MNFKNKLINFMYGRYGVDSLYHFLFFLYIICIFINIFVKSNLLTLFTLLLVFYMFFRAFSKNIYQRSKENSYFLNVKTQILRPFLVFRRNFNDRKKYVYKKCHSCKTTLRLPIPNKRGIKTVVCPECKGKFKFLIFRQQKDEKIEIIRNKMKGE